MGIPDFSPVSSAACGSFQRPTSNFPGDTARVGNFRWQQAQSGAEDTAVQTLARGLVRARIARSVWTAERSPPLSGHWKDEIWESS
jgi:hypothetical protein